jgi:deoxyribodipyrimidine photolyase-like uncharacterized protein
VTNTDQMIENVRIARLTMRKFADDLRAAGVIVNDYDYSVDPETGQITHLTVTIDNPAAMNREEFAALRHGENNAIKLHDFGYRGKTEQVHQFQREVYGSDHANLVGAR